MCRRRNETVFMRIRVSPAVRAAWLGLIVAAVMGCKIGKLEFNAPNPTAGVTPSGGCSQEWVSDRAATKLSGVDPAVVYAEAQRVAASYGEIELEDGAGMVRVKAQGMVYIISLVSSGSETKITVKGSWPADKGELGRNLMNEIHQQIVNAVRPPPADYYY